MEHDRLVAAVKALDPTPRDAELPSDAWSAAVALHHIDTRSTIVQTADPKTTNTTPETRRWTGVRVAALAFAAVLIAGVAAAIISLAAPSTPTATTSFELVGGEDVNDLDGKFGFGFASEPLSEINSPGPTLEVVVGTEVTVTFTNRSGWSNTSPQDALLDQSFRVVPTIPSAETLFGADTGLVEVDGTATITFVADQVGEFRYVSDGLGMAQEMFGRFVVTEQSP